MNIDKETIQALKQRAKEMLNDDYSRKIGPEEIYTIICEWKKTLKELEIKDKIINEMAEDLKIGDEYLSSEYNFTGYESYTIEQIKEEFRKRVQESE